MMSAEEELWAVTRKVVNEHEDAPTISPTWIATHVMCEIRFKPALHHLGYAGCHLQVRQFARQAALREQHDPPERVNQQLSSGQGDFFSDTLQPRYPRQTKPGEEPVYVLRHLMTEQDVNWNEERMRRGGEALLKHADAPARPMARTMRSGRVTAQLELFENYSPQTVAPTGCPSRRTEKETKVRKHLVSEPSVR